jgi:hypothetical protein
MNRRLLRQILTVRDNLLRSARCCCGKAFIDYGSRRVRWRYASAMKKPLRCWLTFHDWRMIVNDEGQRYKTCARCGAYRDFDPRPGMA